MCDMVGKGKGKGVMVHSQSNRNDRSKIRILLCDINAESCQEILTLLCKFSYQGNVRALVFLLYLLLPKKSRYMARKSSSSSVSFFFSFCAVAAVWLDREVFDTLNSEGPNADIILAEVGLLMANDALLLRHIMHEKQLQQIPVIILTTGDEVNTTVKGLKLGAADYLVKPLHDDELLNLWMHLEK